MSDRNFFAELKQRKLVQWTVAYVAAAFALLQGIDIVAQQFGWPEGVRRGITLAMVVGFFVTLVLAWYHGERGAQRVSGSELFILALLLAIGGGFLWHFAGASRDNVAALPAALATITAPTPAIAAISEKSVAVLPFENLSSDKENAYFADGIQDEILTRLSKIAALKVISRTSTQKYKSAPENLREVGKQLGVANILEGSVQKIANAAHINVQLIRVATDEHLWAESYNRKLDDVFSVEGEVATAIAEQLDAKLTGDEHQALAQKPTSNPAAYDAYLRGLGDLAVSPQTPDTFKAAVQSFEEAVRIDPQFALAWARLCRAHSMTYFQYLDRSEARRAAAANSLAEALRLQPQLPEAQLAKADFQYWVLLDYKGARDLFEQLHRSWPSNADVLQDLGWVCARSGDWQKSAEYLDQAIALNPRDLYLRTTAINGRLAMRDFATVQRMVDDALQIWPGNVALLELKVDAFQATGQLDQAQKIVDRLHPGPDRAGLNAIVNQAKLRRTPAIALPYFQALAEQTAVNLSDLPDLINFANLLELSGDKTKARAMFLKARDAAEATLKEQPDNAFPIALRAYALAGLGEQDAALSGFEQALGLTANDARNHGVVEEIKARVLTRFGEKDRAIALLEHLLKIPYDGPGEAPLTPALLRLDPDFDPLRGDPRFEKLCEQKQGSGNGQSGKG